MAAIAETWFVQWSWSLPKCDLDMADEKKIVDISFPSPARCAILFLMILFLKVASGLDSGSNSDKDNWNTSCEIVETIIMRPTFVARPKCNMKKYHGPVPALVKFLLLYCKAVNSDPIHYTMHKNIWSSWSHVPGSEGHQMETSNAN